ncbi:MAG: hypothetical protein COA57_14140 [Flavobacteriales bacterium]|nr:MAG: hypothetical protein COA57_14140 [Flavobacteriales bacterium]
MKQEIKDYFTFNRRERNGILVLLSIIVLLLFAINFMHWFYSKTTTDFSEFEEEIDIFLTAQNQEDSQKKFYSKNTEKKSEAHIEYFKFNPNNLAVEQWEKLGLSEKQVQVIYNYEAKGGKFRSKEDVKKMYIISDELYEKLQPYIDIPEEKRETKKENYAVFKVQLLSSSTQIDVKPENFKGLTGVKENKVNGLYKYTIGWGKSIQAVEKFKYVAKQKEFESAFVVAFFKGDQVSIAEANKINLSLPKQEISHPSGNLAEKPKYEKKSWKKEYENLMIELNAADTAELKKLRGIGTSFSKRIVKYRDLLGGYQSVKQLKEVYGMDEERYQGIKNHISVDASKIRKININTATTEELKSHIYIKWNLANAVVAYREKHGNYPLIEDIKKTDLVNDVLFAKLAPYLTTE